MVDKDLLTFTMRIEEIMTRVKNDQRVEYLDFLNESEQVILERIVRNADDISVIFEGGFSGSERRRAVIYPSHMTTDAIETKVSLYKIEVIEEKKEKKLTHSQVLGSLMGLNIDRSLIGDITVDTKGAFFASVSEFDEFLKEHFTKVGRFDVRLVIQHEPVEREVRVEDQEIIVSSMRLDVIVKTLMNVSRKKAEEYLEQGFVRHNHSVEKSTTKNCRVGDILSIRRHGRFKIARNKKTTKGGKIVLVVSKSV